MTKTQDRPRRVLLPVDARKIQLERDSPIVKPTVASKGKIDRKNLFRDVCLTRVGELGDGEDDDDNNLIQWSFDDFEYVTTLGKGGTAVVVCAKEKLSGYEVALKIQPADDDAICELDVHQDLDHANIVEMFDYFFTEETFGPMEVDEDYRQSDSFKVSTATSSRSLVMILEACNGGTLFKLIRDFPNGYMEEQQAASYFLDAVKAMDYVHNRKVIHCDVKSLNFLVHDGKLKICDFGLSVSDSERKIIGGSPVYMSPEHLMAWRHMSSDFDHRVDVYSLGVMLFEMLVGYSPYEVLRHIPGDDDSMLDEFEDLALLDDDIDTGFNVPVLDLRKLHDWTEEKPFYMPPPIFPDSVSTDAQDLMLSLMEPSINRRISLSDVRKHAWILKNTKKV
eukprot:scaffold919_cov130-Cylindrotheca_fusiformis.AAC.4